MNISVKIGKATFQNPVTVASGTFGYSEKYYNLREVKKLGAITPKTITLKAQEGNPPPRIAETPSGMLNAIGIENPGADGFIETKLPASAPELTKNTRRISSGATSISISAARARISRATALL